MIQEKIDDDIHKMTNIFLFKVTFVYMRASCHICVHARILHEKRIPPPLPKKKKLLKKNFDFSSFL